MKYAVVEASDAGRLELHVSARLGLGWECQGGASFLYTAAGWRYAQAMVRKGQDISRTCGNSD